jgi:hypothetical protein
MPNADAGADRLDVFAAGVVLLSRLQVFEHQRRVDGQLRDLAQVGLVVDLAGSGHDLLEVHVHLRDERQVLGVARHDPPSQLREALPREVGVAVEPPRRVDAVAHVHVHGESWPIDGTNQPQVLVGTIRQVPSHHLDGERRLLRLDGVDHLPAVLDRQVEELVRQVLRIGPVPDCRVERPGDVDAAAGGDGFGKRHPLGDVGEVRGALLRVGIEHVAPGTDFGDDDVLGRERLADRANPVAVGR